MPFSVFISYSHHDRELRQELEEILGIKIFLELRVKVEREWRQNARIVQQLDWRRQLERLGSSE